MKTRIASSRITEGVIWKQLLLFFFPILMGSFFQQMYNMADTIIVGRAVGTQALAAVGSSGSLINLINGFFIGLSSGATVVLSQHYGAADRQGVENSMHTGYTLSLILGGIIMLIGILLGPWVLHLIETPENCMDYASTYVQIYFSGAVASMVYNMGTGILRAMGDSKRPMLFLIIACVINIVLDLLFVVVLQMGVAGAAIATVFSQYISAILVTITLLRLPEEHRFRWSKLGLNLPMLRRILSIGIPAGLTYITFDLSNLLAQRGINSFGDVTAAAWNAYVKSDSIIWMVSGAFGVSVTTFVGQNFGARKYDRIHKSVWTCLAMSVAIVGLLSALETVYRVPLLSIYTRDPEVIQTGAYMMLRIVPYCALFLPMEVLGGAMRGTGYSLVPTLINILCICVFRVAWILIMVGRWHTLDMLTVCYPISWILTAMVYFVTYLRGNWLRKHISNQPLADTP